MRKRSGSQNHVWAYDFVMNRTHNRKRFLMLTIKDEYPKECLAIKVDKQLNSIHVEDTLLDLFIMHGVPDYILSDNGTGFTARLVREWLEKFKIKTLSIKPGNPWKKVITIHSMVNYEMNCLTERFFIHSKKPRC